VMARRLGPCCKGPLGITSAGGIAGHSTATLPKAGPYKINLHFSFQFFAAESGMWGKLKTWIDQCSVLVRQSGSMAWGVSVSWITQPGLEMAPVFGKRK